MSKVKQTWREKWLAREKNGNSSDSSNNGDQHGVHHTNRILCTNRRCGGVDVGSRTWFEKPDNPGDVDINTIDTSTPTHNQISGLITQARVSQLDN
jgi:hypothetical protein